MPLNILGAFTFGGVDSESSAINLPPSRSLRCRNFVPKAAGLLELRYGYNTVNQDTISASVINSPVFYRKWDNTKNVVYFQGLVPKNAAVSGTGSISTLTVTSPTVKGTAISSTASWAYYFLNNRLHAGNGADQKFFDGTNWRNNGLAAPSAATGSTVSFSTSTLSGGLPATVLTGYLFYLAYYNPNTQHVSNRVQIAATRAVSTGTAIQVDFANLPDLSAVDTEYQKVFARTGDGGEVPYMVTDSGGNFLTAGNTNTTASINVTYISIGNEMPTRNGVIPSGLNKFAVVGDVVWGNADSSPSVYRCGRAVDDRTGDAVGRPEQSWAPNDLETFPTNEAVTGLFEVDQELLAGTLNDSAILTDVLGVQLWRGPWNVGIAGKKAGAKTPYGFFWLTGDKQIATLDGGIPVGVSGEYEKALLSQLGSANLSKAEVSYVRDPDIGIDKLVVKALDSSGNPLQIHHDFNLTDARSAVGQGYDSVYVGQLASDYSPVSVRDGNGKARLWAAGANGRFYQLFDGASDGGTEFEADYIALLNAGQERLEMPFFDWVGDQQVRVSVGRWLKSNINSNDQFNFDQLIPALGAEVVEENNFQYRAKTKYPELNHLYIRLQLTSHSADGSLALNSPPHLPVENYGRIYAIYPAIGAGRPR